jgi:hypothetical protein
VPFFEFFHDRVGTDVQHPGSVTNPTRMQGHLDNLLFDRRRLPGVTLLLQDRTPRTTFFSAPVPLLALSGLAMAHDVGPVTVGTVQDLKNHEATRSRWGSRLQRLSWRVAHQHL